MHLTIWHQQKENWVRDLKLSMLVESTLNCFSLKSRANHNSVPDFYSLEYSNQLKFYCYISVVQRSNIENTQPINCNIGSCWVLN